MKTITIVSFNGFLLGAFSIYEEAIAYQKRHEERTRTQRSLLAAERQYAVTTLVVDEWVP